MKRGIPCVAFFSSLFSSIYRLIFIERMVNASIRDKRPKLVYSFNNGLNYAVI